MSEGSFLAGKHRLVFDREGVTVAAKDTVDFAKAFKPSTLGIDDELDLVEGLGDVLSHMTGVDLDDADGIYDFSVRDAASDDRIVGTLVISVSDGEDAVELSGEVANDVSARELMAAVVSAIGKAAPEAFAD